VLIHISASTCPSENYVSSCQNTYILFSHAEASESWQKDPSFWVKRQPLNGYRRQRQSQPPLQLLCNQQAGLNRYVIEPTVRTSSHNFGHVADVTQSFSVAETKNSFTNFANMSKRRRSHDTEEEYEEEEEEEKEEEKEESLPALPGIATPETAIKRTNRELRQLVEGGTGRRPRSAKKEEPAWVFHRARRRQTENYTPADTTEIEKTPSQNLFGDTHVVPDDEKLPPTKPPTGRTLLDNRVLEELVTKNCQCLFCNSPVTITLQECLAVTTTPVIVCSGKCGRQMPDLPPSTGFEKGKKSRRIVEYATNVLFVLAFMAMGDGGTEASKLLGFLNVPNSTTMANSTFRRVEADMNPIIIKLGRKLLHNSVLQEVKVATANTAFDYQGWLAWVEKPPGEAGEYPLEQRPELNSTMDGAWNQRSAGRSYSSKSGFAILVGTATWMPIGFSLRSTFCRYCSQHLAKSPCEDIPPHRCQKNHEGSAGSMESAALLHMYHYLYERYGIVLKTVVTDDDSTMKSHCRWSNADYEKVHGETPMVTITKGKNKGELGVRPDHGELRHPIPEPQFLADPAHRKKTLRNHLYKKWGKAKAKENKLHEGDIIRITRNFAYMSRQLPKLPKDKWADAGKAVLQHHFDDHQYCGDFCKRKKELKEGTNDPKKTYRCTTKDKDLYELLLPIVQEFTTPAKLEEIGHGYHTNVNESFHNLATWHAQNGSPE